MSSSSTFVLSLVSSLIIIVLFLYIEAAAINRLSDETANNQYLQDEVRFFHDVDPIKYADWDTYRNKKIGIL